MPLRSISALIILILQLCACSSAPNRKAAVDEMERRHAESIETLGGGGAM